jgi:hypothetical protein
MDAAHFRLRRLAALVILGSSFFCGVLGLASVANGLIGLTTGKEQWIQIGTTTIFGLGPVFGLGAACIALGYGLGRAGLSLWRNPHRGERLRDA